MVISWSITEIVRYGYFALNGIGIAPYFVKYLRYSLFLVLYPSGITGEVLCVWNALKWANKIELFQLPLPEFLQLGDDLVVTLGMMYIAILVLYLPGSPVMYLHMLKQRSKYLGNKSKKKQ